MRELFGAVLMLVLGFFSVAVQAEEKLDKEEAVLQCGQGSAIYCLALGMAEEKAGHKELALEHYRRACKVHPSGGHLRACTPMLAIARELGRLDETAGFLEERCSAGDTVTCFYLGKEYLKISETERAADHLSPLCQQGFHSPDPQDYGPCYHMAGAFQQAHQFDRARALFDIDCQRHKGQGPSCEALRNLNLVQNLAQKHALSRVRSFDPREGVLVFLVLLALLDALVWARSGPRQYLFVCVAAPVLMLGGWLLWELWPLSREDPPAGRIVILFSAFLVLGLAALIHQASQNKIHPDPGPQPPLNTDSH